MCYPELGLSISSDYIQLIKGKVTRIYRQKINFVDGQLEALWPDTQMIKLGTSLEEYIPSTT